MSQAESETCAIDPAKVWPGPGLLVAGPGTGKTYQLARRAKFLIEDRQVDRDHIALMTFTREAARNMRNRLSDEKESEETYIARESQPWWIGTIHGLCNRIIGEDPNKADLPPEYQVVHDEGEQETLVGDAAQICGRLRDDGEETLKCRMHGDCQKSKRWQCKVCERYRGLLRLCNAIDFDEQLFLACEVLKSDQEVLSKWRERTKYLLVDEYQDINPAQYELIRLLSTGQEEGLFVVGDDDQSIYRFRGGRPEYVRKFAQDYGGTSQVLELSESRRCPPRILRAAIALIEKADANRVRKPGLASMQSQYGANKVQVHKGPSDKWEASFIARETRTALETGDVIILVPGHRFSPLIKAAMRRARVPYDCKERLEDRGLKVMDDALRWLEDVTDDRALRMCLQRMITNAKLKTPFPENGGKPERRERTLAKVASLWETVAREKISLYEAVRQAASGQEDIAFLSDRLTELEDAYVDDGPAGDLLGAVCGILRPWTTVSRFSDEVKEWMQDARARDAAAGGTMARILTMQGAKGLQAETVFVAAMTEGIFPSKAQLATPDEAREARRLMYVSMTRSSRELHLMHARTRSPGTAFAPPRDGDTRKAFEHSPFIDALPSEDVTVRSYGPQKKRKGRKG